MTWICKVCGAILVSADPESVGWQIYHEGTEQGYCPKHRLSRNWGKWQKKKVIDILSRTKLMLEFDSSPIYRYWELGWICYTEDRSNTSLSWEDSLKEIEKDPKKAWSGPGEVKIPAQVHLYYDLCVLIEDLKK